jgi:hypothetical protein
VNVCEQLRQIAPGDTAFCPRVITADPGTKQQSSQYKSPNSPKQVKIKAKSMLIIFYDIKVIVDKEFVLACQTVNSAYCCDFSRRLHQNVRRLRAELWGQKGTGCCITTTHRLTLPFSPGNV